jgi:hypothetical protein
MLRKETVSDALLGVLNLLMAIPDLENHRLVGGTALALQLGHRISVDIDLFSSHKSDYQIIEEVVYAEFKSDAQLVRYISSPLGKGISWLINGIKVDVIDWNKDFGYPVLEVGGIRMAGLREIAAMKLEIITSNPEFIRYEKKDFVDLAFLLDEFSFNDLVHIFQSSNPGRAYPDRLLAEALQLAELADKKPQPRMLILLDWQAAKDKINAAVKEFFGP